VNDTGSSIDYYQQMLTQFGGCPPTADYTNPGSVTQPPSRATPYYVSGDMTTSRNWLVGSGQTIIFFVSGNLTINGTINITGDGFTAFIVNGKSHLRQDYSAPGMGASGLSGKACLSPVISV
jgi:hypothetical protein